MTVDFKLTEAQLATLKTWRAKGREICNSVGPADLKKAEDGFRLAYDIAGRQDPSIKWHGRIEWTGSPHAAEKIARKYGYDDFPCYGNCDAIWLWEHAYYREVLGKKDETEPLAGLIEIAKSGAGFWYPMDEALVVSERPTLLKLDNRDRLHCEDGPSIIYPDGWKLYCWHNVEVPKWILEEPKKITSEKIMGEKNQEIRSVMIQKIGGERFVRELGAEAVDRSDWGTLWRATVAGRTVMFVEVVDATADRHDEDGDPYFKHYFLRVDPDAYGGVQTALAAVASTWKRRDPAGRLNPYFKTPEEYAQALIAQS